MLQVFAENLLPVFLAAGAGYLLAARLRVEPRPITHLAFFVLAPCLVFDVIVDNPVSGGVLLRMVAFAFTCLLLAATLAGLVGWAAGWSRRKIAALFLVVLLPNAGNYGLSVSRFAFGEPGLAQASLFFVTSSIVTFTLGVFVASLGRAQLREALVGLLRVPTIWAVPVAFLLVALDRQLPFPVERTVAMLADACIPVFLVVLGMRLHGNDWKGSFGALGLASGMRLLAGAALALILAPLFGLEGVARQAGVLQSAMPSAVICIILATEYDVEPAYVTTVVCITTLASPLTLTPLLRYLGA